jgi:predicted transcriptional regulator
MLEPPTENPADLPDWQISEIQEGLREADTGDFATDEEVSAVFSKWTGSESSSRK